MSATSLDKAETSSKSSKSVTFCSRTDKDEETKSEKSERSERSEITERSERCERSLMSERSVMSERSARSGEGSIRSNRQVTIKGRKVYVPHSLDEPLTLLCQKLAVVVEKNKFSFVVIPFLVAIIFAHGLGSLNYATDNEYLFVPTTAPSLISRQQVEAVFPTNYSAYIPGHESRYVHQVEVIVVPKTGGSVLNKNLWEEMDRFNDFVGNKLTVTANKVKIRFQDVCAKFNEKCLQNGFLAMSNDMQKVMENTLNLTYPIMKDSVTFSNYLLAPHLGGLDLIPRDKNGEDKDGEVKDDLDKDGHDKAGKVIADAKAMRLIYVLDSSEDVKDLADAWEDGALQAIQNYRTNFSRIEAVNSKSIARELVFNIHDAIPYIPFAIGLVISYTVANMYHPEDPSKIKIWVGILGLVNTIMATVFAWGVLGYVGCPWQAINLASVFLLLGVGLDDTFVMLSAWNHTDPALSLEKRMEETYKEAAVSITITSLTNILSFVVGGLWPGYTCVQIFCFYTGTGIFFVYIYNLTFFGAFLAFFGELEEKGCHGFFFCVSKDSLKILEDPDEKPVAIKGPITISQHIFDRWLPDLLIKRQVRILILVIFGIYLGLTIYWCAHTREGFERRKLARNDSSVVNFYNLEDTYFRGNPYRFQILIDEPLDYSNETVRKSIESLIEEFRKSDFISNMTDFDENWLAEFEKVMKSKSGKLKEDLHMLLSKQHFMSELDGFLKGAANTPIVHNIKFSKDKSEILASRFFLQSSQVSNSNDEMAMLKELRKIAANSTIKVILFNPFFPYIDLFLEVSWSVITCLLIGTFIMFAVALVLIPNFSTAFWVFFTIVSIEVGVFGFMYIWNVNLDVISMICLIMCIGFSVDFSAHISYHFMASDCDSVNDRLRSSLSSFGTPVIQGGFSTILAVVVFADLPSYILQSFAKMLFLVISLGVLHGLFILPVLLSLYNGFVDFILAKIS